MTKGDLTLDGKHTMQYTDDVSQKCMLEIYIILLTNVTSINSIKNIYRVFISERLSNFPVKHTYETLLHVTTSS